MNKRGTVCHVETLALSLIAAIMFTPGNVSVAATPKNSAARDLAAAKSFAFGGIV
jgi:hypothetical protein